MGGHRFKSVQEQSTLQRCKAKLITIKKKTIVIIIIIIIFFLTNFQI